MLPPMQTALVPSSTLLSLGASNNQGCNIKECPIAHYLISRFATFFWQLCACGVLFHHLRCKICFSIPWRGGCSGTPVLSGDNAYVFLTHNNVTLGTFTVLDATDGNVFYQEANGAQLLSPTGISFNPHGVTTLMGQATSTNIFRLWKQTFRYCNDCWEFWIINLCLSIS